MHFILFIFLTIFIRLLHIKFSLTLVKKSTISIYISSDISLNFDKSCINILLVKLTGNFLDKSF